jgi:hypothetical protein
MNNLQFRILYREFLFRMVDLELLSPQGDITKLLGQFAGLLIWISSGLLLGALFFDARRIPPNALMTVLWSQEHFLIATTMLVVGLFAVLSWESTFLNRRDVLVLAPLPIRARTMFLAKVASVATALSLTVVSLHTLAGVAWPVLVFSPANSGLLGMIRSLAAYWVTMLSAGAFIFCSVLGVQGLAAQLPRRLFLRLSAVLQMAAFCLVVSVYFLQPSLATPRALAAAQNQHALAWLPSYWFLGLFQALNGSMHPAMAPLARRACLGLALAIVGAGAAFLLSYFRTLRKIVEEPDIVAGVRGVNWLPRFGNSLETAVVQFSIRTLLRSRQHRVILAFYLGIGFALVSLLWKNGGPRRQADIPSIVSPIFSSIVMMTAWVVGTRVVFAMPLDLRANWMFRVTSVHRTPEYLAAIRRPLFVLSVGPVWLVSAAVFLSAWPWRPAVEHLVILGLWGTILAYVSLYGFHKIPFTCSYLPGKSKVNLMFIAAAGLLQAIGFGIASELRALHDPARYAELVVILGIAAVCCWWRTVALARAEESVVLFEEEESPAILGLGLFRDGALPTEAAAAPNPPAY